VESCVAFCFTAGYEREAPVLASRYPEGVFEGEGVDKGL
jgi:hypothetical protein